MLLDDGRSRAVYGLMLGVLGDSFGAKICLGKQFALVQRSAFGDFGTAVQQSAL